MSVSRDAAHMWLSWKTGRGSHSVAPEGLGLRLLQPGDGGVLGTLMWNAYRGTIDDEYATPAEATAEADAALAGTWGPVVGEASVAGWSGDDLVAAVLTVRDAQHDMMPLLAFCADRTDMAKARNRGVADSGKYRPPRIARVLRGPPRGDSW